MREVKDMQTNIKTIPSITNDGRGASTFGQREVELSGSAHWMLSDQQNALNFRLRSSSIGYQSDWHVAGDPTLLIILSGTIAIELRDGQSKTFTVGDMFIAQDYLAEACVFNQQMGHRARVVGQRELSALHLKLAKQTG